MKPSPRTNRWLMYFQATRPAFLSITALACLLGMSIGSWENIHWLLSLIGLILALIAHAAANVINDYHDSINGSDWNNTNRIYPFTGGSRFIQEGILTEWQIKRLAIILFSIVIAGGLMLVYLSSLNLLWIGVTGIATGWFYSAKPFQLMSRGIWGEISISIAWALIVVGSYWLNNPSSSPDPKIIWIACAYGVMVSTILFINQIPDIQADRQAKKITLAAASKSSNLSGWYAGIAMTAYALLIVGILNKQLPWHYGLALVTMPWHWAIANRLQVNLENTQSIKSCIIQTILLAHLFALVLITINLAT